MSVPTYPKERADDCEGLQRWKERTTPMQDDLVLLPLN